MVKNKYVDTSIHAIPGFSGCLEHTGNLNQLIHEASESKRKPNGCWAWLGQRISTWSVPHDLINAAMKLNHILHHIRGMITNYFEGFKLWFKSGHFTPVWQQMNGSTDGTISPIMLISEMNLLITAAERESKGSTMESGIRQPRNKRVRGRPDHNNIYPCTSKVDPEGHMGSNEVQAMDIKKQSVIRNGKVTSKLQLQVQHIKCLEKWYDSSLNEGCLDRETGRWLVEEDWRFRIAWKIQVLALGLLPRLT